MKKKGFISTSLIYTFFILFLLLMLYLLNSYSRNRFLLEQYKLEIKQTLYELTASDINLFFMVYNDTTNDYELTAGISLVGHNFEEEFSYCKNGSTLEYNNGKVSVSAERKDICYAYFRRLSSDVTIKMYTKSSANAPRVEVKEIPNSNYYLTSSSCTNGAQISFSPFTNEFLIVAHGKTVCEVEFTNDGNTSSNADITLRVYTKEDAEAEAIRVNNIPDSSYSLTSSSCESGTISFNTTTRRFSISASEPTTCEAVFTKNGG